MRLRRYLCAGVLAAVALTNGCDRGNHPKLVDKPAPQFALKDGAKNLDLSQMRGRVVVLHFWGSWCAPCLGELQPLMNMQTALPQVSVVAIGVPNADAPGGDEGSYRQFLTQHPLSVTNLFDSQAHINQLYGSVMFPETYIIDKHGVMRRKFVGGQDWMSADLLKYLKTLNDERA